jgi:CRISPR system Cascade subunit CasC
MQDKDACRTALIENPSVDLALFGRMVASDPSMNYDAAAQVAHAISTHGVQNEFDYFTAVDDLSPETTAGAGHLGTVEFNSSTLYRYATVNVSELFNSLVDETPAAVRNFLEAFVCSMPTGKQNTFANRTLPDAVYVTVRKDQPINLVGAFEQPVMADHSSGYAELSCKRLAEYAQKVYANYADKPEKEWALGMLDMDAEIMPLPKLLDAVEAYLSEEISKG